LLQRRRRRRRRKRRRRAAVALGLRSILVSVLRTHLPAEAQLSERIKGEKNCLCAITTTTAAAAIMPESKVIKYPEGRYEGEVDDNDVPHGEGELEYPGNDEFERQVRGAIHQCLRIILNSDS
jgi:hypothetical protein